MQGFRGKARPELGNVALEAGADEVHPPAQARGIGIRQQAFREPAAQPERVEARASDLAGIEWGELQVADASGERLARLLQQVDRRGAEHEEAPLALPAPAAGVDEATQAAEELRCALDLVEDDELVRVLREIQLRLRKLRPVRFGFEVEIDRRPLALEFAGQFQRQGGLADLARPRAAEATFDAN